MNKAELVAAIAETASLTKADANRALDAFMDVVTEQLKKGDKVTLVGFGTFEARERAARTGRNPQTGEIVPIASTTAVAFKVGTQLKNAVAGK